MAAFTFNRPTCRRLFPTRAASAYHWPPQHCASICFSLRHQSNTIRTKTPCSEFGPYAKRKPSHDERFGPTQPKNHLTRNRSSLQSCGGRACTEGNLCHLRPPHDGNRIFGHVPQGRSDRRNSHLFVGLYWHCWVLRCSATLQWCYSSLVCVGRIPGRPLCKLERHMGALSRGNAYREQYRFVAHWTQSLPSCSRP